MKSQEIIESIKNDKYDKALDSLYKNYPAFKNTLIKSGGKQKDAEDIFQDALLVLIEKLKKSEFELKCSVHTFLFSICRNLSLVYFKKQGKAISLPIEDTDYYSEVSANEYVAREQKYLAFDEVLEKVGEKCLNILKLFYTQNTKMSAIAKQLGFKSETSAKTQKYKCLEKARKLSEAVLAKIETIQS